MQLHMSPLADPANEMSKEIRLISPFPIFSINGSVQYRTKLVGDS